MGRSINHLLIVLILSQHIPLLADNDKVTIEKTPGWTVRILPDLHAEPDKTLVKGGYYYLLSDSQYNVESKTYFYHCAIKIIDFEGIKYVSDISVDFDPAFQHVTFHKIVVHRNGKSINKLIDHEIKTFQREQEMERNIYDGRLTAVINLKDIRLDDIIEYEYTVTGINPIYKDKINLRFPLDYYTPIEHSYIRAVFADDSKVSVTYLTREVIPEIKRTSNSIDYIWDRKKPKTILLDSNVPYWFDPRNFLMISNFNNWEEVVNLMIDHYQVSQSQLLKLKSEIEQLVDTEIVDQKIVKIIRFVQDEVRYLGFESGLNAYKPHPPDEVMAQRFGDCKDKSLLLCTLLKACGIEAYPVLVNTNKAHNIEKSLPSIKMFDHVIVQIKYKGIAKYIDPTYSNQGGHWEFIYTPDYRKGLVIKEGVRELVDIPKSDISKTVISETFDIDEVGRNTKLNVSTVFYGADADFQRQVLNTYSLDRIEQFNIDYYCELYPGITIAEPLQYEDRRDENEVTVTESYRIKDFWQKYEVDSELLYCNIYAGQLEYEIGTPQSASRTMPYYIGYPIDIFKMTILNLPEVWEVEPSKDIIKSDDFYYEMQVEQSFKTIKLIHRYQTHRDHVPAKRFVDYRKKVKKINDNIHYQLTSFDVNGTNVSVSWFAVTTAIIVLIASGFFAVRIYQKYDPLPANHIKTYSRKIGGWLILIAIGLSITPLILIFNVFTDGSYFDVTSWKVYTDPNSYAFNLSLAFLFFLELVYNILLFTFSILLIILFFKRRTSLPNLIIIYLIANAVFNIAISVAAYQFADLLEIDKQSLVSDNIGIVLAAAIWIPYFMLSERVKDTFTEHYKK